MIITIRQAVSVVALLALLSLCWGGVRADEAEDKAAQFLERLGGR